MKIMVRGNQVNYELDGPPSGPVLMLSHALATSLTMWEPQMDALARGMRVLRYDVLGHGGTDAPRGPIRSRSSPNRPEDCSTGSA